MNSIDIFILIVFLSTTAMIIYKIIKKTNEDNINMQVNNLLNIGSDNKENFAVADADDFHRYNALSNMVKKVDDNFDKEKLLDPPKEDQVDYDKEEPDDEFSIMIVDDGLQKSPPKKIDTKKNVKSYVTAIDYGWDAPFPIVSCANSSIENRYKSGPVKLMPWMVNCGFPNSVTAENFFKTHYMAQPARLEDYAVRGSNYMLYSKYTHPSKLNVRILSQNTKGLPPEETKYRNIPSGSNFGFHNSPAMSMP